ncbi:SNF2 family DNA-dependent ATPase [Butyriboletus roseoflavus]|nr:SNF2 family DNA-dependent ATPase [Butyriboletus roseoflavus]
MSLSRILNDPPPPARAALSVPPRASAIDTPLPDMSPVSNPVPVSPVHPRQHHQSQSPLEDHPPPPRGYTYQPVSYQGSGGWDPYSGNYVQGDIFPLGPGGNYYPQREVAATPSGPREPLEGPLGAYYKEDENDHASKKRRKAVDDDPDYQPPGSRRPGLRRNPPRSKAARQENSPSDSLDVFLATTEHHQTDDDRRLVSSDLSDSEEVWIGELSDYIMETHKRQRQVESWFEASVLERNSTTAVTLSRHYVSRIARIPPPPPSPPPMLPVSADEDLLSSIHPSPPPDSALFDYAGDSNEYDRASLCRSFNVGAEAAARELEESLLGSRQRTKRKDPPKRPANGAVSDASSDLEMPTAAVRRDKPANKKRRVDCDPSAIADEFERSVNEASMSPAKAMKSKGKGKVSQLREHSAESTATSSLTPRGRKKSAGRKKHDGLYPDGHGQSGLGSAAGSVAGDVTPSASRPASPALTVTSTVVYELDEVVPPLKRAKKVDDSSMAKRLKSLEEAQRKVWTNIARRDIAKVYKYAAMGYQARQSQVKRLAMLSSMQARRPFTRTAKANKDVQAKAKRLMREMLVFWRKNEREERDVRKREQKEAIDRAKIEEERREAARQARKLEFLISQTELYSHFVGNKLKTAEIQGDILETSVAPAGADLADIDPSSLGEINFDDEDQTNLHRHARHNAQEAIALAKQRAQQFDTQAALERKTNEALQLAKAQAHIRDDEDETGPPAAPLVDLDSDELNFQNPTSLTGPLTIKQPRMLMAQLKEYQLKGLNWLATLYEQGINGILADEMGLGKTVQSISLLAYLAEVHDIWGPFLVVAPASTLHNWQQEITRFVPTLKALPYWGNVKDRATLRKFWSKKEISYHKDAPFHVLITSYQLVTQDQQYFQRVKWQYMILDEAQNIKNASSVRWKTLLGFQCRNRLLLTGTPIQNSMQELWALLHFIMPSLFDSHDEFNEWFSKDIENAAENKGSKLNEHQLRRLHMILKPFMLRRVKRHVQNELSEKIEIDIYVDLSSRQRALYRALLANVSVADLLEKAANIGDADSARSLMNLVMQFRKVCNHPELFERAGVMAPFSFADFGRSGPLGREGDLISVPYSTRNPIEYQVPELLYLDGGLVDIPSINPGPRSRRLCARNLFNVWSTDRIYQSMYDEIEGSPAFAFLRLLSSSPAEVHGLQVSPFMRNRLVELQQENKIIEQSTVLTETSHNASDIKTSPLPFSSYQLYNPDLKGISSSAWQESCLSRPGLRWFVPAVVAPPISMTCTNRTFIEYQNRVLEAPVESIALYGLSRELQQSPAACSLYNDLVPMVPAAGLVCSSPSDQLPQSSMQIPEAKRLVYDSAKLARLDMLLQELKAGDHRVLIYFQMTRMMDLMEEYLIYRQYRYLRLDGSSKLEDRRDMVIDWQTRPDIFVFLLSTRAGGLGINLTAADTVIFYDHDWNPSNDAQAMDRAHRLGQTRQVTVYRLITKGTIDERIIQLARVKKDVQDIVVGNKNFTDVAKPSEIVQLLLNDEQLANIDNTNGPGLPSKKSGKRPGAGSARTDNDAVRDLWNDEGDDFFGHLANQGNVAADTKGEEDGTAAAPSRGKKRKGGGSSGVPRPRKTGGKAAGKRKAEGANDAGSGMDVQVE